jgi:hypothetical protein
MVRRRSTVRFRNRTPGHGQLSNESDERRRTSPEDARQLPSHRRHPLHSKSLAAIEGSRRRAARDSLVAARARSRWARRPAAEAIAASMSPSRSTVWPLPVSSGSAVPGLCMAGRQVRVICFRRLIQSALAMSPAATAGGGALRSIAAGRTAATSTSRVKSSRYSSFIRRGTAEAVRSCTRARAPSTWR